MAPFRIQCHFEELLSLLGRVVQEARRWPHPFVAAQPFEHRQGSEGSRDGGRQRMVSARSRLGNTCMSTSGRLGSSSVVMFRDASCFNAGCTCPSHISEPNARVGPAGLLEPLSAKADP